MNFNSLIKKIDEIENSNQKTIFESIGRGDEYFVVWEREIHPVLCEVALNPDQIQQLFKDIEKGAGRSGFGKAVDAVKGAADKVGDVWFNKFGGMLQSSGPVQAFDQKWEEIKSSIAAKNPGLASKLAKYGEFAQNNPKLHKFLLAIGGSVAAALGVALAGGVGAGALAVGTGAGIATGIVNIADRLLQGQKASTAIGRGATTGAIAGLSAALATKVADMVKAGFRTEYLDVRGQHKIMNGSFNHNGNWAFATGRADDVKAASRAFQAGDWGTFNTLIQKMRDPAYLQSLDASREIVKQAAQNYKQTSDVIKTLAQLATASAGGAASAATNQQPKESLSESQIQELFGITGNKVDASSLEKAWKKAGSPTDSDEISKILSNAGVDNSVITQALSNVSAATTSTNSTTASTTSSTTDATSTGAVSAMKASEIVDALDKVWSKATADQGSQTSSPQVQQKIIAMAKTAGMTGQTFEGKYPKQVVGVYSKFLGENI